MSNKSIKKPDLMPIPKPKKYKSATAPMRYSKICLTLINKINLVKIKNLSTLNYSPVAIIFIYFCIHFFLRIIVSDTIQVDDIEQILYGGNLELGYPIPQPPMYTWLIWTMFKILGVNIFALSLLKYSLLFFTFIFIWKVCNLISIKNQTKKLIFFSYLLMPSFFWHAHQGFTHTILLGLGIVLTFYYLIKLTKTQKNRDYFLFGFSIFIGLMGKYSFIIFLPVIILSALSIPSFRKSLLDKKIFLSIGLLVFLVSPHLYWLIDNYHQIYNQAAERLLITHDRFSYFENIFLIFESSLGFITPLVFFIIFKFNLLIKRTQNKNNVNIIYLLNRFFLIILLASLSFPLFYSFNEIKVRWLHPILMLFPFWIWLLLEQKDNFSNIFINAFKYSVITISFLVLSLRFAQVYIAPEFDYYPRLAIPIIKTLNKIPYEKHRDSVIKTDDYYLFAHLVTTFPKNKVSYQKNIRNPGNESQNCLIINPLGIKKNIDELKNIDSSDYVYSKIGKEFYVLTYDYIPKCR